MRAVNLLPRQAVSTRRLGWNTELTAGIAFTLVIVIALCGGFFVEKSHADSARQQLATAQAALDAANSQPSQATGLQPPAVLAQAQPWHLAIDTALATRVSWDVLLTQLEYVVPAKVGLSSVTFGSASDGSTTTATVALGGTAYSLPDVAVFIANLERLPKLSGVSLVSTAANTGSNVMTFQITAQVSLPTAPAPPVGPTGATSTGGSA